MVFSGEVQSWSERCEIEGESVQPMHGLLSLWAKQTGFGVFRNCEEEERRITGCAIEVCRVCARFRVVDFKTFAEGGKESANLLRPISGASRALKQRTRGVYMCV